MILKKIEYVVNREMIKKNQWLCSNRLALNISKTNFVVFFSVITLQINKKAISEEICVKYLSILIDSTLSWKPQISTLTKQISGPIGIMYKLSPFINVSIMRSVYYSIIYPHLIYGLQVWGSAFKTELENMNILQNKVVRMNTFSDSFPSQGYVLSLFAIISKT